MKNELVIANTEYLPEIKEDDLKNVFKIARAKLPELGTLSQSSGKGLYKCVFPNGVTGELASKDGAKLGTIMGENGGIVGQARWVEQSVNPTTVFVAAALHNIEVSLEKIEKETKEMFEFEQAKEEAKMNSDYQFLTKTLRDYQMNMDNDLWLKSSANSVMECKKRAMEFIDLYKNQSTNKSKDEGFKDRYMHTDEDAKDKIDKTLRFLGDYQKAVFLFALADYDEVILTNNYKEKYLSTIANDIEKYSIEYRNVFTDISYKLEGYSKNAIEFKAASFAGNAMKELGNAFGKIPVLQKAGAGEKLVETGKGIKSNTKNNISEKISKISDYQKAPVFEIENNIRSLNSFNNQKIEMYYDDEYIYLPNSKMVEA